LSLIGAGSVMFSSTHLALILGASRICYVGFDWKVNKHYYDEEPYRSELLTQLDFLLDKYKDWPFAIGSINDFLNINIYPRQIPGAWFPPDSTYPGLETQAPEQKSILTTLFSMLNDYQVEPISTYQNSIITDIGAKYIPLEELV